MKRRCIVTTMKPSVGSWDTSPLVEVIKMGGLSVTAKYKIYANIEIDGIVEKSDVIGGIFGQTEGLLGEELDLRELQKNGRIGRIEVRLEIKGHRSFGEIIIPSNLDRVETALIAAAIETVDKIGPYNAAIKIKKIQDLRSEKRKKILERAKEILRKWSEEEVPESKKLVENVIKSLRSSQITYYGPEKLPSGPNIDKSDTIVVVEGRADVINLLKHGYKNVIALGGASIPKTIVDLSKKKTIIAFVDGDRGGEIILKNLFKSMEVDYVARAPQGREVEELTGKEIAKALKSAIPAEELIEEEKTAKEKIVEGLEIPEKIFDDIKNLEGTLESIIYNKKWEKIKQVPVRELVDILSNLNKDTVKYLVFDGIVTQRILDIATSKSIELIIGARIGNIVKQPENIRIYSFEEIKRMQSS